MLGILPAPAPVDAVTAPDNAPPNRGKAPRGFSFQQGCPSASTYLRHSELHRGAVRVCCGDMISKISCDYARHNVSLQLSKNIAHKTSIISSRLRSSNLRD